MNAKIDINDINGQTVEITEQSLLEINAVLLTVPVVKRTYNQKTGNYDNTTMTNRRLQLEPTLVIKSKVTDINTKETIEE